MTNNTVLEKKEDELEEKEDKLEKEILAMMARFCVLTIVVFILFTYLGWFQWNKDTGLRKIIKAIIQFIFSIIIGFNVSYFVTGFRIIF